MSFNSVQFVIWGIRDGFKSNLMSNGSVNPFVSHLTDQRQLWNKFKNQFYSITRASGNTLITIFDPTVLDIIGRDTGSTIAISLVAPQGYLLKGDPLYTLRQLMAYYVSKQNGTTSFGFTQSMFEEEIVGIELISQPAAGSKQVSFGKKGFIQFQDESSILSYFQHLDIGPYEQVLFFSDDFQRQYPDILVHQFGAQPISSFQPPVRVTLVGYLESRYEIRVAGKKLTVTTAGELDALPGEQLEITALNSGQTKIILVGANSHNIWLDQYFPRRPPPPPPPPPFNGKKLLIPAFVLLLLGFIGFEVYDSIIPPPPPPGLVIDPLPDPKKGNEPVVANPNPPPPKWYKDTILFSSIEKNLYGINKKQQEQVMTFSVRDTVKISFIKAGIVLDFTDVAKRNNVRDMIAKYLMPKRPDKVASPSSGGLKSAANKQGGQAGSARPNKCEQWRKDILSLNATIEANSVNKTLQDNELQGYRRELKKKEKLVQDSCQ
jgi:hypothetical protein